MTRFLRAIVLFLTIVALAGCGLVAAGGQRPSATFVQSPASAGVSQSVTNTLAAHVPAVSPSAVKPSPSPSPPPMPSLPPASPTVQPPEPATQAVVVLARRSGYKATVVWFEWTGGHWSAVHRTGGVVGSRGVADDKKEGDRKTPKGAWPLGFAFGTDMPETGLDFRAITRDSYWVDDPNSEYYNTWQEGKKGWKSAEHLIAIPGYRYAVVVQYNAQRVPGAGSAIFVHCGDSKPTTGCVAIPKKQMVALLKWLRKECHPVIVIGSTVEEVCRFGGFPKDEVSAGLK